MSKTTIFLHIPRTGGAEVERSVGATFLHYGVVGPTYDVNYREAAAGVEGSAKVIASHWPYGAHENLRGAYDYVTVLRHPVRRAVSDWLWARTRNHQCRGLASSTEPDEFVKRCKFQWNIMVKLLAGHGLSYEGDVDDEMYEDAVANLEKMALVGFTYNLTEFIDRLCSHLGHVRNRRGRAGSTGSQAIKLTDKQEAVILEVNDWDYRLYNWALSKFSTD